jgi:hypothetical protein
MPWQITVTERYRGGATGARVGPGTGWRYFVSFPFDTHLLLSLLSLLSGRDGDMYIGDKTNAERG